MSFRRCSPASFSICATGRTGPTSLSFYAVYSLADEAELALQITLPEGKAPDAQSLGSELGMQPVRAALEYRHYF